MKPRPLDPLDSLTCEVRHVVFLKAPAQMRLCQSSATSINCSEECHWKLLRVPAQGYLDMNATVQQMQKIFDFLFHTRYEQWQHLKSSLCLAICYLALWVILLQIFT